MIDFIKDIFSKMGGDKSTNDNKQLEQQFATLIKKIEQANTDSVKKKFKKLRKDGQGG